MQAIRTVLPFQASWDTAFRQTRTSCLNFRDKVQLDGRATFRP